MMKISTKGRYGLRILADLAMYKGKSPRLIREISQSQNLSEKYVGRLIIELRKGGFVNSVRGAHGGYVLAKRPSEISLLDVLETMEGDISIVDCVTCPLKCKRAENCLTRGVWAVLNEKIRRTLSKMTLSNVIGEYKKSGADFPDYCI